MTYGFRALRSAGAVSSTLSVQRLRLRFEPDICRYPKKKACLISRQRNRPRHFEDFLRPCALCGHNYGCAHKQQHPRISRNRDRDRNASHIRRKRLRITKVKTTVIVSLWYPAMLPSAEPTPRIRNTTHPALASQRTHKRNRHCDKLCRRSVKLPSGVPAADPRPVVCFLLQPGVI
jgi:hypothetical protein